MNRLTKVHPKETFESNGSPPRTDFRSDFRLSTSVDFKSRQDNHSKLQNLQETSERQQNANQEPRSQLKTFEQNLRQGRQPGRFGLQSENSR
jgi:hypothetical protein